ncbi:hypothetical protein AAMO2058_001657600, partial [Amorphochlora amoebiformis]
MTRVLHSTKMGYRKRFTKLGCRALLRVPLRLMGSSGDGKGREIKGNFFGDRVVWKRAAANTTRCLIGCSLGDFSMMFYLQSCHPEISVTVTMIASMLSGLSTSIGLETVVLKATEDFSWSRSLSVAFGMSFISML